jgi:uncharacterized protein (DUF1330 family)
LACYGIFDIEITDPAVYKTCEKGAEASIAAAGGKYIVRGGDAVTIEGRPNPHRVVVLEFGSRDAFNAWYHSPDYSRWKAIRQKSAKTRAFSVVGV